MDFTPLAFVLLLPLVNWDPCLIKIVVSLSLSEKTLEEVDEIFFQCLKDMWFGFG
jgi:hypothetical protein